jgi:hypothetical protein
MIFNSLHRLGLKNKIIETVGDLEGSVLFKCYSQLYRFIEKSLRGLNDLKQQQ